MNKNIKRSRRLRWWDVTTSPPRVLAQSWRGLCWRLAACPPQPTRTNLRPRGRFWVVRSPGKTIAIECSTQYRGDPLAGAVWGWQWWARASFRRNALLSKGWGLLSWEESLILGPALSLTQHWGHLGSFWSHNKNPKLLPSSEMLQIILEFTRKPNSPRKSHSNSTWQLLSLLPNGDQVRVGRSLQSSKTGSSLDRDQVLYQQHYTYETYKHSLPPDQNSLTHFAFNKRRQSQSYHAAFSVNFLLTTFWQTPL